MFMPRRLLLGSALAVPFIRTARAQQTFEFVAGSLGGGWYTMGAGIAALVKDEAGVQIRVVPGGGLANPTRINNGQSQMGWGIDAFTAAAVRGEEPYRAKHDKIRTLGTGYSPTEHNFLRATEKPLEDMRAILTQRGLRIGCPQRSSTDEMTLQRILKFFGTSPEKIRAEGGTYLNGSYNDVAAAFGDGQVDYCYFALAKPAAILTELGQGRRAARLVAFPEDLRKHLIDAYAYNQGIIPAATYPALQSADVPVTTMDSVVVVHQDVPEEVAYKMTKVLIGAKGQRLTQIHASMAAYDPAVAWKYEGAPLHPGAAKAYREAGVMPG
ncbi:TAXI family TRAP transporter solute-binding subunit [Roseomonas xinghualingensis]|uniref:TAXI family TRAP transporter solute-binding subunit n=1 Tax=Roseomonas xinghualingensis TaxID=2986475 RepID=UPI0021F11A0D|nr:TAXI family TRAP transporter solute-binding subunit [Roseomonas sp. SXEYE001]MCV4207293.1 TAXI family TRAP transporter solute-binding subunit [Roseomonas sp. SXEYE001]